MKNTLYQNLKKKTTLVCFATAIEDIGFVDLELRQLRLIKSAQKYGIERFDKWGMRRFKKTNFYREHKWELDHPKGAGFWLWKPYVILDALSKCKEGELVLYLDCGFIMIDDPQPLLELCVENGGIYIPQMEKEGTIGWLTKRRTLALMDSLNDFYLDQPSVIANIQIYQKNPRTVDFVKEYLYWCTKKEVLVDDEFLGLDPWPGEPKNQRHTHDQSILSVIKAKHGIEGFRCPYQHGNHNKPVHLRVEGEDLLRPYLPETEFPNSQYGTIFHYEKEGYGGSRPLSHYINPYKLQGFLKRKISI